MHRRMCPTSYDKAGSSSKRAGEKRCDFGAGMIFKTYWGCSEKSRFDFRLRSEFFLNEKTRPRAITLCVGCTSFAIPC